MKDLELDLPECHNYDACPREANPGRGRLRILLLQGPVGSFFRDLEIAARKSGHDVTRYAFNQADCLFSTAATKRFPGDIDDWRKELPDILERGQYEVVVGFGSNRPMHIVARAECLKRNIPFLSLEEGYVRPGFITAEWGGNNATSPLAGNLPMYNLPLPKMSCRNFRGHGAMFRGAVIYYTIRNLCSSAKERSFFHREINLAGEVYAWGRSVWKRWRYTARDAQCVRNLIENHSGKYFLVPLQVSTDANLQGAACGWTVRRLTDSVLASFAKSAPKEARLVFKIHPMALGHGRTKEDIRTVAAGNGIEDRVDIIETGGISDLAKSCAGMVTINSTSGFCALEFGCPLLVVGKAVYTHPALATCAKGDPDFDSFWSGGYIAPKAVRNAFISNVVREALLPGDFYASRGRRIAVKAVLEKLTASRDI